MYRVCINHQAKYMTQLIIYNLVILCISLYMSIIMTMQPQVHEVTH